MKRQAKIKMPFDMSGRNAIFFVQHMTNDMKGSIFIEKDGRRVNAKSMLGVLSLGIKTNDEIDCYSNEDSAEQILLNTIEQIQGGEN